MKIREKSGLTLVEMLCSVLIVLLVSVGLTNGVQLAVRTYYSSITNSEAQVLSRTLETAVSEKLRSTSIVYLAQGTDPVCFTVSEVGERVHFAVNDDGQVLIGNDEMLRQQQMKLLPSRAYPNGLKAKVEITAYDTAEKRFTVQVTVYKTAITEPLAQSSFEVHSIKAEIAK